MVETSVESTLERFLPIGGVRAGVKLTASRAWAAQSLHSLAKRRLSEDFSPIRGALLREKKGKKERGRRKGERERALYCIESSVNCIACAVFALCLLQ